MCALPIHMVIFLGSCAPWFPQARAELLLCPRIHSVGFGSPILWDTNPAELSTSFHENALSCGNMLVGNPLLMRVLHDKLLFIREKHIVYPALRQNEKIEFPGSRKCLLLKSVLM